MAYGHDMKTTVSILGPLEHEILDWAIHSDFFGEAEGNFPIGWSQWDRTCVLNAAQLVLDWETPHIATYAAFILMRLQDLSQDARDKYAESAKELERRIRRALKFQGTSKHIKAHQSTSKHIKAHQSTSKHIKAHQSTSRHEFLSKAAGR
jgi:hypothetical protein